MHPLDCVRIKRTITWPGAPHRSVLLSGPASSAERRRRRHKQMLWKALWNGRELVRTLPEPCRTVPCRADCHNSVHSPARPLAFLNFLKGRKRAAGRKEAAGDLQELGGSMTYYQTRVGKSGIWLHVTLMVLGDLWSSL